MTAWLSFAMWLTLMPCGYRGGGGRESKKKCVLTTFLTTAVIKTPLPPLLYKYHIFLLEPMRFYLKSYAMYMIRIRFVRQVAGRHKRPHGSQLHNIPSVMADTATHEGIYRYSIEL